MIRKLFPALLIGFRWSLAAVGTLSRHPRNTSAPRLSFVQIMTDPDAFVCVCVSRSGVGPPTAGYPTGPKQSDGGRGRHGGPQLRSVRKPLPHHPVEEGRRAGVLARLQGQAAGHGRSADTLCEG